ncbi:MAG TPA: NAD(P)-binding protein [Candidatus Dormibacteraeota bacterium]|nr:NAD(P)-binding protein [Candidatus Dormibacteraeota bacterium]
MDTDYLVVGAGASGLAFADTLLAEADVAVTLVDRREGPGGHWQQAYPFVRLHTPSAYYGVNSLALGADRIDPTGENAGYYERATGEEVREYFASVAERLTQTGRVQALLHHDHLGGGPDGERVRDLATGTVHDIGVRQKVVDARYLEASIPATHMPPYEVASTARIVPVNDLPAVARPRALYAVIGSGKTAADACIWLLDNGVEADRIRWIRPRDAWFHDRRHFQPLDQVAGIMEGLALDAEAGALASSIGDLAERLENSGRLVRVDPSWAATMYRGTMLSSRELDAVRQIKDVLRLGRVRRIEADRILLDRGEAATQPELVHVDCSALGLNNAPGTPIFQPGRIVLQQVRHLSPSFNAALIAFVEAHRTDEADKNRLCPPNPYPSSMEDWPGMITRTWRAESRWLREPDIAGWVAGSRLNLLRDFPEHAGEPAAQAAAERFVAHVPAAIENLGSLSALSTSR